MAQAKQANGDGQAARKMHEAWDKAWNTMQAKVPPLLAAVADEFRSLLDVTMRPNSEKS